MQTLRYLITCRWVIHTKLTKKGRKLALCDHSEYMYRYRVYVSHAIRQVCLLEPVQQYRAI